MSYFNILLLLVTSNIMCYLFKSKEVSNSNILLFAVTSNAKKYYIFVTYFLVILEKTAVRPVVLIVVFYATALPVSMSNMHVSHASLAHSLALVIIWQL